MRAGVGGKMSLVKTNNKNYLLFVKCWDHDDQMSWNVMATTTTLGEQEKKEIYDKIESLGFSKEFIFEQKFDTCKIKEKKSEL